MASIRTGMLGEIMGHRVSVVNFPLTRQVKREPTIMDQQSANVLFSLWESLRPRPEYREERFMWRVEDRYFVDEVTMGFLKKELLTESMKGAFSYERI